MKLITHTTVSLMIVFMASNIAWTHGHPSLSSEIQSAEEVKERSRAQKKIRIESRVGNGKWKKRRAVYPIKGETVQLRITPKKNATIRWYLVFADLTQNYNNANPPFEDNPYQWRGFEPISYHRIELTKWRNHSTIEPFEHMENTWNDVKRWFTEKKNAQYGVQFYTHDMGTFWFQIEMDVNGKTLRSAGVEDITEKGLSKEVLRVSIREQEGYLGWATSFYNVPGVFGSVLYQSKNYIGADCADVLMTAWSKWKKRPLKKNYNVQMLLGKFPIISKFRIVDGMPDIPIKWEETVFPGDLIAVRYGNTGKKFHHIGTLYKDANSNGLLDKEDIVLHAGPDPLHLTPLKHHAFDGHIVILRP